MTSIWRYMDLWKFRSILEKQALYFSTAASQNDHLEGVPSLAVKIARAKEVTTHSDIHVLSALHNLEVMDEVSKGEIVLSCWHINDNENPRMWKEYLNEHEGVAIQSSYDALVSSFTAFSHAFLIETGEVLYIDRTRHRSSLGRRIDVFSQKEEGFAWEHELRCAIDMAILPLPYHEGRKLNWEERYSADCTALGVFIPVALQTLVERVVVSPGASDTFYAEVKELCSTSALAKPIERSGINP